MCQTKLISEYKCEENFFAIILFYDGLSLFQNPSLLRLVEKHLLMAIKTEFVLFYFALVYMPTTYKTLRRTVLTRLEIIKKLLSVSIGSTQAGITTCLLFFF